MLAPHVTQRGEKMKQLTEEGRPLVRLRDSTPSWTHLVETRDRLRVRLDYPWGRQLT